jgi:hypothetical protein
MLRLSSGAARLLSGKVPASQSPAASEMPIIRLAAPPAHIHPAQRYAGVVVYSAALVGGFWPYLRARGEVDGCARSSGLKRYASANTVLFELDAIANLPGSTQARELLVKRAQKYLDNLASETGGDDALQRERAIAYERIGDVLGLPKGANLGRTSEALESYSKALAIYKLLASSATANATRAIDLARVYNSICQMHQSTGEFRKSLDTCMQAEGILAAAVHPEDLRMSGLADHQNAAISLANGHRGGAGASAQSVSGTPPKAAGR